MIVLSPPAGASREACPVNDPIPYRYATDRFGFYIAASDQEILSQVNRLMVRSGFVGVMDTAGRMQYVIDGRRGAPFAAKRIMETTERVIQERTAQENPLLACLSPAVDMILTRHQIAQELKGYRYLRFILLLVGLDDSKLRPISKTLYPAAASHFRVSSSHIERDIRYALRKTDLFRMGLATSASVCRLYGEMMRCAEDYMQKETPSAEPEDDRGRYRSCGESLPGLRVADQEDTTLDDSV